jgi:hypothetical protein
MKETDSFKYFIIIKKTISKFLYVVMDTFDLLPLVFKGLLIGPIFMVISLSAYQWYEDEYPSRPLVEVNTQQIQHPNYHELATNALDKFTKLPINEQETLKQNLKSNTQPLQQWLTDLNQHKNLTLCLGESHHETARTFMAQHIFKQLSFDALYLETNKARFKKILQKFTSSTQYFPMLDVDIMEIMRSAKHKNTALEIYAIDVDINEGDNGKNLDTKRYIKTPREEQILANFTKHYTANSRNAVLFGALHCNSSDTWFFGKLTKQNQAKQLEQKQKLISSRIFSEHQDGPIEAFVYFLDKVMPIDDHFVIKDTTAFANIIDQWFPLTQQVTFKPYQSIIFYRHGLMTSSE